jgi:hypothetical protein
MHFTGQAEDTENFNIFIAVEGTAMKILPSPACPGLDPGAKQVQVNRPFQ